MHNWKTSIGLLFLFLLIIQSATFAAQSSLTYAEAAQARAAELVALAAQFEKTTLDCSHFVNSLFERVGLHYEYEPSRVLYRGMNAFRRVYHPAAGDLIVWPGHVGIVVNPDGKTFLSALSRGVRVSSYTSHYWRRRGRPRFMRYSLPVISPQTLQAREAENSETFKKSGLE